MKAWEIYDFDVGHGKHPVVIVSHAEIVASLSELVVLSCSSQRANRKPEVYEVLLDEADGLDWQTLCRCDRLYTVKKKQLLHRRGQVTPERRRLLAMGIVRCLALAGI